MDSKPPSSSRKASLEKAAKLYHQNLPQAQAYLTGRDIDMRTAERYGLGVVVEPAQPDHRHWVGRLTIPYVTPTGVVQLKARCIQAHDCKETKCTKYFGEHGIVAGIYNTRSLLTHSDTVVITEGELDAITVETWLGIPAVGIPGTSVWKDYMALCFEGFATVIVVADGEEVGRQAAERIAKMPNARVVHMPDGMDSNSLLVSEGPEALAALLGVG